MLLQAWRPIAKAISDGYGMLDRPFENRTAALALRIGFALVMGWIIWMSFAVGDAPLFQRPDLARIFFWHFPCPMMASLLLLQGAWYSFAYVRTEDMRTDAKALATLHLGFVFCLLTMATGIVFSKSEWGAWWQWDPRQTSFLLVILIYGAYFVLRGAYRERERKAAYGAGYVLAATLPAMFLIFVFPRLPQIAGTSLHPTNSISGDLIKGAYAQVILLTLSATTLLTIWLYRIHLRVSLIELDHIQHELEISRGGAASAPVVRPVRVSADGRSQGEPPSV